MSDITADTASASASASASATASATATAPIPTPATSNSASLYAECNASIVATASAADTDNTIQMQSLPSLPHTLPPPLQPPQPPQPPPPSYGPTSEATYATEAGSSSSSDEGTVCAGEHLKTSAQLRSAYREGGGDGEDESESESESESTSESASGNAEERTVWQARAHQLSRTARRTGRRALRSARKAKKHTQLATGNFFAWAFQTDAHIRRLYAEDGLGVRALLERGYSLERQQDVLGFTRVKQLCLDPNGGLTADVMGAAMWDSLVQNFAMKRGYLEKYFALSTFGEMLGAGLFVTHLCALGFNTSILAKNHGLCKADLRTAFELGWRLDHWMLLRLNEETLFALAMAPGDYLALMNVAPSRMADKLGLYTSNSREMVERRARIGIVYRYV